MTEPECGQSWLPSDWSGRLNCPTVEDNYLIVKALDLPVWGSA